MSDDQGWHEPTDFETLQRERVRIWRKAYTALQLWRLPCPLAACHRARACVGDQDPHFPCTSDDEVRMTVNRIIREAWEELQARGHACEREAEAAAATGNASTRGVPSPAPARLAGRGPRGRRRGAGRRE